MRATLNLDDDPSWSELIALVDIARDHVAGSDRVQTDGRSIHVDVRSVSAADGPVVIPADLAVNYARALEHCQASGSYNDALEELRLVLRKLL